LRLGYFGTQNTPDRCSEMPTYYRGPDGEHVCSGSCSTLVQQLRSPFPQRTLYLHYGNCGEMQQVLGAAARAALLPVASLDAWADDHVWNELFLYDRWVGYTIYRSDASIQIDPAGLFRDGWAAVARLRGDGWLENATERYTPTLSLEITVADAAGRPVDGAALMVATEYNKTVGEEVPLVPVMMAWTDAQGSARIALGTERDYYLSVDSRLGSIPGPERNIVQRVLCLEETDDCPGTGEAGVIRTLHLSYENELPARPRPTRVRGPGSPTAETPLLTVAVQVEQEILEAVNPLSELTFEKWYGPGGLDILVLDATSFADFERGAPFTALAEIRDGQTAGEAIALPETLQEAFVVVANPRATRAQQVTATVATHGPVVAAEPSGPTPGCGCNTRDTSQLPLLGLLVLGLALRRRRRSSEDQLG
jgi:MYXO-CTERM domain-containing protein